MEKSGNHTTSYEQDRSILNPARTYYLHIYILFNIFTEHTTIFHVNTDTLREGESEGGRDDLLVESNY